MPEPTLALTGSALLALGLGVALHQRRRAARCPRHSPVAGTLAWLVAAVAGATGIALLAASAA